MKALVTGGGGFIGRAILQALLERGDEVRSFSRGDYPELRELGAETARGDIGDLEAVKSAVEGCDVVFHVASRFDLWGKRADFVRTNVTGTENVVAACRAHGVPKLVYTSTPSVVHGGGDVAGVDESAPYPEHFEALYPETKAMAERIVLAANDKTLTTVAIRPHLVWGPGDTNGLPRLLERARAGKLRLVGRTPRKIDTCFVGNAVAAHLAAADLAASDAACAGKAYFVTQDEPVGVPTFINDMLAAAGEPPITRTLPAGVAKAAAAIVETVWKLLGIEREPPVTRYMVSQLATDHYYDISAARRDLGYAPSVDYAEGMQRLAAWAAQAKP